MTPRAFVSLTLVTLAATAGAQQPVSAAPQVRVEGTVFDSISHSPLASAMVQFVPAASPASGSRSATTDASGRFELSLPAGEWLAGFEHPRLDSLGLVPPPSKVRVDGTARIRLTLATPSFATVARAYCGPERADSDAVLVGLVLHAGTMAGVQGAQVLVQWSELNLQRGAITRSVPTHSATTNGDGWYVLCGIPPRGEIAIWAEQGAAATGLVVMQAPAALGRMDFAVDTAATKDAVREEGADTVKARLTAEARRPLPRVGATRFHGMVRSVAGGPIANARVHVVGRRFVLSDARGVFTLDSLAGGSQTVEVLALGFVPGTHTVTVAADAPADTITMTSVKSLLDTVRVTAGVAYNRDRTGFGTRSKSGLGKYLARDSFARAFQFTDVIRRQLGVTVETRGFTEQVMMTSSGKRCVPAIWMDGMYQIGMSTELNHLALPAEVEGVEIYRTSAEVPPQFVPSAFFQCGAIVIWTRQTSLPKLPELQKP